MTDFTNIPEADDAILNHPYVRWQGELLLKLMSEMESVKSLLSTIQAENLRLKNLPAKPKITASTLDVEKVRKPTDGKRPGSTKQKKKRN